MNKISTYILTEEFSTAEVLKLYCSEFEALEPIVCSDLQDVYSKISADSDSIILVDFSDTQSGRIDFIAKTCQKYPKCKVIALSDNPSVNLIVEAMRAGAK